MQTGLPGDPVTDDCSSMQTLSGDRGHAWLKILLPLRHMGQALHDAAPACDDARAKARLA